MYVGQLTNQEAKVSVKLHVDIEFQLQNEHFLNTSALCLLNDAHVTRLVEGVSPVGVASTMVYLPYGGL